MSDLPKVEPTQEVRFAVVMYGGVSLAIYMNGVAQELLNMVRSTAPSVHRGREAEPLPQENENCGTSGVYRQLGQMVERGQRPKPDVKDQDPIRTRFIVDVISGTSAGGINGVFLAKALANKQSMSHLKELWIRVGDLSELLVDKRWGFAPKPKSLLDGSYMYSELLKALESMEQVNRSQHASSLNSPYAEELDLFVTATDISGLTLPIRLANGVVHERRHKSVFRFSYATQEATGEYRNELDRNSNPFLAFAARCTSSFPIAFEPMRLVDIDSVVRKSDFFKQKRRGAAEQKYLSGDDEWRKFYKDYVSARGDKSAQQCATEFKLRGFGDGGYLDNKPFSYVTDALMSRRADVPVLRKLIFVDPDPRNPDQEPDFDEEIDVLTNTMSAIAPTSATETIREEIQRILDRNRLIERLSHFTADVDKDVKAWTEDRVEDERHSDEDERAKRATAWVEQSLDSDIRQKGLSYGAYHRVKVSSVTDSLARMLMSALDLKADSDEFLAIQALVRAWRDIKYEAEEKKTAEKQFLLDFDIGYRLRRLNFLRAKIDEWSRLGADDLRSKLGEHNVAVSVPADKKGVEDFRDAFRGKLAELQKKLSDVHRDLLALERKNFKRGSDARAEDEPNSVIKELAAINSETLRDLLKETTTDERTKNAREKLKLNDRKLFTSFDKICNNLMEDSFEQFTKASEQMTLTIKPTEDHSQYELAARTLLWRYYLSFEDYDMVIFPITYQTDAGEAGIVDVVRISPYDATSLLNEAEEDKKGTFGRHKLAGTALGHFGAFFERSWRQNDIMWGRLDTAEIIIKTLLPDWECANDKKLLDKRNELIKEANQKIMQEEFSPIGKDKVREGFVRAILDESSGLGRKATLQRLRRNLARSPEDNTLRQMLESCLSESDLHGYLQTDYEVNRRLDPQNTIEILARTTKIIGKMLETLAEKHRIESKRVAWVTRLGQIFWGLVQVAVPNSFWNLLFRHWIKLLYAFEIFLLVGGTFLLDPQMQRSGAVALAITIMIHAMVKLLGDYMRRGHLKFVRSLFGVLMLIISAAVITSAVLGFDELVAILRLNQWNETQTVVNWMSGNPFMAGLMRADPRLRVLAFFGIAVAVLMVAVFLLTKGATAYQDREVVILKSQRLVNITSSWLRNILRLKKPST